MAIRNLSDEELRKAASETFLPERELKSLQDLTDEELSVLAEIVMPPAEEKPKDLSQLSDEELAARTKEAFPSTYTTIKKKTPLKTIAAGALRALADFGEPQEIIAEKLGLAEKGRAAYFRKKAEELKPAAELTGVEDLILHGIGALPVAIPEFMASVPYAAAKGGITGGVKGAIVGAAERAVMGGALKLAGGLKPVLRIPAMGATGAVPAAVMGGSKEEIVSNAILMAAMGAIPTKKDIIASKVKEMKKTDIPPLVFSADPEKINLVKTTKGAGGTYNLDGTDWQGTGYVVEVVARNISPKYFSKKTYDAFANKHLEMAARDPNLKFGNWHFDDGSKVSMAVVYTTFNEAKAIELAKRLNQQYIYHKTSPTTGENIPTGGTGLVPKKPLTSAQLDAVFEGRATITQKGIYVQPKESLPAIARPQPPQKAIELPQVIMTPFVKSQGLVQELKTRVGKIVKPFLFYKDFDTKTQNDIRLFMGNLNRLQEIEQNISKRLFGGLSKQEIGQSARLTYARKQLEDVRRRVGLDPNKAYDVQMSEAMKELNDATMTASEKARISADEWKTAKKESTINMIKEGRLKAGELFEDYAPIWTLAYLPEWYPYFNMPKKLRTPFRAYTKGRAEFSNKEYRKDADVLVKHLTMIEYDRMLDTFISTQANRHDITGNLSREQKAKYFGVKSNNAVNPFAKPSKIYNIDGVRYRAFTPDKPFSRQTFQAQLAKVSEETGEVIGAGGKVQAIGGYKKTYLVPEKIYDLFENFQGRGVKSSAGLAYANMYVAWWKSLAIASVFPRFNVNNFVGDFWMVTMQHPEKIKFFKEIPNALDWLVKKAKEKPTTPFETAFGKWVRDQRVLEAQMVQELPHIGKTKNPFKFLVQQSIKVSQFRENILRTANALYCFKEMQAGRGADVVAKFDWIDTKGLTTEEALGKISRNILIDYNEVSKTFVRMVRGLGMPFGTWYIKGSSLMWEYTKAHPVKALAGFMALPVASLALNNRSEKIRELYKRLPPHLKEGIVIVLGETPDGRIRVFNLQTPQDALIGTKIFSIATNQINMVLNGEKDIKTAAIDTLKTWGIREAKGIAYLLNPAIRFITGLVNGKDPFDSMPLYPRDTAKMDWLEIAWSRTTYFGKCMMPFIGGYVWESGERGTPDDILMKKNLNNFIGLPALGIRDYNERTEVYLPNGKAVDYDVYNDQIVKLEIEEAKIMGRMKDRFVDSGLTPKEFYQSEAFEKTKEEFREIYGDSLKGEIATSLTERVINGIEKDLIVRKKWYSYKAERATTPEDARFYREQLHLTKQEKLVENIQGKPKSVRLRFLTTQAQEEE